MCMYTYVCMYVCVHTCVCVCIHVVHWCDGRRVQTIGAAQEHISSVVYDSVHENVRTDWPCLSVYVLIGHACLCTYRLAMPFPTSESCTLESHNSVKSRSDRRGENGSLTSFNISQARRDSNTTQNYTVLWVYVGGGLGGWGAPIHAHIDLIRTYPYQYSCGCRYISMESIPVNQDSYDSREMSYELSYM